MIDPDRLFSFFGDGSEEPLGEVYSHSNAILNLQDTPAFKIGMFKKIIWNQQHIAERIEKFREILPGVDELIGSDEDAGEFVTHVRAWHYIKELDFENQGTIDAAKIFADIYTNTACDLAIKYWEEKEEYERCAQIKKLQNLIKDNLIY